MKLHWHTILLVLLICIGFLPFWWLHDGSILLGHDNVYPLAPLPFLYDRFYSWTTNVGMGTDQSGVQGSLILHALDAIPQFLGFSATVSQRIVFSFWFLAIMGSAYICVRSIERQKYLISPYTKYFVPVLYGVNFYVLQAWWVAERAKFGVMVAAPLLVALYLPCIKNKITWKDVHKRSIIAALILSFFTVGGWGGIPLYGGLLLILGSFYIFTIAAKIRDRQYGDITRVTVLLAFTACWFVFLNAYTLLPFIAGTFSNREALASVVGGVQGQISWARYLSENTSIMNLLRLQGIPDWYNNGPTHPYAMAYLTQPFFIAASYVIPFLLLAGYLFVTGKNRNLYVFFSLLYLAGLVFSAGTHIPTGKMYEYFMRAIPGFYIFRSPIYKFGYAYWFAASMLLGLSFGNIIGWITKRFHNPSIRQTAGTILTALFVTAVVLYHFSYITADLFRVNDGLAQTRVRVPSYVDEFARWWSEKPAQGRILLFPKLNDDWLFEQYAWRYQSLYPLLGHYGSHGIVENMEILAPNERVLVDMLYEAYEKGNFDVAKQLSERMGIQYLLVRGDFAHDVTGQETTSPDEVLARLTENPYVYKERTFGLWTVFTYDWAASLFDSVYTIDAAAGDLTALLDSKGVMSPQDFVKSPEVFTVAGEQVSQTYVVPQCISCVAETNSLPVFFPDVKILPDSPLYPFMEWKNSLVMRSYTGEARIFALVGKTLKLVAELDVLNHKNKTDLIPQTAERYRETIHMISNEVDEVIRTSANPYNFVSSLSIYLTEESKFIYQNAFSPNRDVLLATHNALTDVQTLIEKLARFFNSDTFTTKKVYEFHIENPGRYEVLFRDDRFGLYTSAVDEVRGISVDTRLASASGMLTLGKGKHRIELTTKPSDTILGSPTEEAIAGGTCFSSYGATYNPDYAYHLQFLARNAFSDRFYFLVDDGDGGSPVILYPLTKIGTMLSRYEFIIPAGALPVKHETGKIRVTFCASQISMGEYEESIQDVSLTQITAPKMILRSRTPVPAGIPPDISYKEISPTRYEITVENVTNPYFLIFRQTYSPQWIIQADGDIQASHFVGNGYNNTWYIPADGPHTFRLVYDVQKYFWIGSAVSAVALLAAFRYLLLMTKKHI